MAGGVSIFLPTLESVGLSLMDAAGKAVLRRLWNGEALWIANLPTGAYLLRLDMGGQRASRKLFVP